MWYRCEDVGQSNQEIASEVNDNKNFVFCENISK